ncbi:CD63 antigen [Lepeophtheirus salmonis]|uniref:CD63 molecule [Ochotona princeps] n=1 Tax=Lepeophtheirus salmonis TaxID=72036 RepID=A0A0K2U360_LEPSM|nr:CD63 antigen-like [Lepeophtheirus salmonis]
MNRSMAFVGSGSPPRTPRVARPPSARNPSNGSHYIYDPNNGNTSIAFQNGSNALRPPSRAASVVTLSGNCSRNLTILQFIMNFILLTASLILIGTGAGLMGFYRIHMLDMISVDFLIVPLVLVVGGVFTLLTSNFGFYVAVKGDPCLLITYSVFLSIQFVILIMGIVSSVRLLFDIQAGLYNIDVIADLRHYETDSWVRYKWDTLQSEYSCCGGYRWGHGYMDWKGTDMGARKNSVPDSCCLNISPQCGANVFDITDPRKVIGKIHIHGCLTIMFTRLETHVQLILIVFAVVGGILAIIELLGIVMSCCMASSAAEQRSHWEGSTNNDFHDLPSTRPVTPSPMDVMMTSQHETAF